MDAPLEIYDDWHHTNPTGTGPWYELVRAALVPDLLSGARVLEIGCGGGDFAAWMAEAGAAEVVAQDFSATPIAQAQRTYSRENLSFSVGDIEAIESPDAAFDVVVSCETIEHVPHPDRAVAELASVLRPGGTLMLTTPNYMSLQGIQRMRWKLTGRKWDEGGQPIANLTSLPRTATWVRRAGLRIERLTGDIWTIPVGGEIRHFRPSGTLRSLLVPVAFHQLLEARKD